MFALNRGRKLVLVHIGDFHTSFVRYLVAYCSDFRLNCGSEAKEHVFGRKDVSKSQHS